MIAYLVGILESTLVVALSGLGGGTVRVEDVVGAIERNGIRVELDSVGVVLGRESLVGLGLELLGRLGVSCSSVRVR
jgi:hypothetical protein